jgi:hypothetical protein
MAGVQSQRCTRQMPNTKKECNPLDRDFQFHHADEFDEATQHKRQHFKIGL